VRVVSLVPSATETLLALGVVPVAVTRFCEQPGIPTVGGTKDPDIATIVAMAPDVVILCEEENRREDADALAAAGVATCALVVESVADAEFAVGALGAFAAAAIDADLELDLGFGFGPGSGFAAPGVLAIPPPLAPSGVRAFVPIWRRPWMTMRADTYGSSMLEHLGIANVFADADVRYPTTSLEEVAALAPDVVLAPSEPYPFKERHVAELSEIAPVELIDGQDLFWWGSRTPDALQRLRRRLARWAGDEAD
jgi:ABC-type Fe3+-hydroxamate transport system substrate-binding protein